MSRVGVGAGFGEQARVSSYVAPLGMDRFLGYGLKYETGFKDTHLGNL